MSLESWKTEFYPHKPNKKMTDAQAIAHSITKWNGLAKENLKKHNVKLLKRRAGPSWHASYIAVADASFPSRKENKSILSKIECGIEDDSKYIIIDYSTCALCLKYNNIQMFENFCKGCPLYRSLSDTPCYLKRMPYSVWENTGNPSKMIAALKKASDNCDSGSFDKTKKNSSTKTKRAKKEIKA